MLESVQSKIGALAAITVVSAGCLVLSGAPAHAAPIVPTVFVTIDDLPDALTGSLTGPVTNQNIQNNPEGIGVLGLQDMHFEFISADPGRPGPGAVVVTNYNILDPDGLMSDSLNITITGHTPTSVGDANVSVDLHFRSDSTDEIAPPPLAGGINIFETGAYQTVDSGLADLSVKFRSDVPEPFTLGLFGLGLAGLGFVRRRRAA